MGITKFTERLRVADRARGGKAQLKAGLRRISDLIYPPRCLACPEPTETPMGLCGACWREVHFLAGPVCDICGTPVSTQSGYSGRLVCDACMADPPGWDRGRAAVAYEGVGRQVVMGLKSRDRLDTVDALARWMTGAGAAFLTPQSVVVPVPLFWRRRVARRYNQAAELGRAVATRAGAQYAPYALERWRATQDQKGLTRAERHHNLQGAIRLTETGVRLLAGAQVVLVDDVMTTGATLAATSEAVRAAHPARINVLVLARVAKDD